MEIIKRHLVFIWKSDFESMKEILETKDGYYFYNTTSGFFQITKINFEECLKATLEMMSELHVTFSEPRKIKGR